MRDPYIRWRGNWGYDRGQARAELKRDLLRELRSPCLGDEVSDDECRMGTCMYCYEAVKEALHGSDLQK